MAVRAGKLYEFKINSEYSILASGICAGENHLGQSGWLPFEKKPEEVHSPMEKRVNPKFRIGVDTDGTFSDVMTIQEEDGVHARVFIG